MSLHDDIKSAVNNVLGNSFSQREGHKVPSSEDVALANGAVKIEAAFLYADLAGSGTIARSCPWHTTAKLIRAYLDCAVRIIRAHGGAIRSFDGDRVMGVFVGEYKRTNATKSALQIQWATRHLIQEEARKRFKSVKDNDVKIQQACGIDVGVSRAVRAGIRNNNDLIWVGSPPSLAAKLSDIREYPYCTYISTSVYNRLADEAKLSRGVNMWEKRRMNFAGFSEICYRSSYWWKPKSSP